LLPDTLNRGKVKVLESHATSETVLSTYDQRLVSLEAHFETAYYKADSHTKHMIANDQFGNYLTALAHQLDARSAQGNFTEGVSFLMCSKDHLMTGSIQRKVENDPQSQNFGLPYFAVTLFDPNVSNTHVRVLRATPDALQNLKITDMLEHAKEYHRKNEDLTLVAVCKEEDINLGVSQLHFTPQGQGASPSKRMLQFIFDDQLYDAIAELSPALKAAHQTMPAADFLELLEMKNKAGFPFLYRKLYENDAPAVRAYGQLLQALQLPPEQMQQLWTAENAKGKAAIHMALGKDKSAAAKAWLEQLGQFDAQVQAQMSDVMNGEGLSKKNQTKFNADVTTLLQTNKLELPLDSTDNIQA
jgi:hypothetical protein